MEACQWWQILIGRSSQIGLSLRIRQKQLSSRTIPILSKLVRYSDINILLLSHFYLVNILYRFTSPSPLYPQDMPCKIKVTQFPFPKSPWFGWQRFTSVLLSTIEFFLFWLLLKNRRRKLLNLRCFFTMIWSLG